MTEILFIFFGETGIHLVGYIPARKTLLVFFQIGNWDWLSAGRESFYCSAMSGQEP